MSSQSQERDAAGNRIVGGIHRTGCNWALSHGETGVPEGRTDQRIWMEIQASDWFAEAMAERDAAVARARTRSQQ